MKISLAAIPILLLWLVPVAEASGWSTIDRIYYDPSQDDVTNKFLLQAASELKSNLEDVSGSYEIVNMTKPSTGIFLSVEPSHAKLANKNEESFWLFTDESGIHIIGKSPIAVRHGAYTLFDKLGYRWFFKHPIWNVQPSSLATLNLDEVHEPSFTFRLIWHGPSPGDGGWGKTDDYQIWKHRNRLDGSRNYEVSHSYDAILKNTDVNAPDSAFCPSRSATYPRQLNPTDEYVYQKSLEYVRNRLSSPAKAMAHYDDAVLFGVAPVSPNDGAGWCTEFATNPQLLSNMVFNLSNNVAKEIADEFPGKYVGVYSYSDYDLSPTINLEPNLLVQVVNFGKSTVPYNKRIMEFDYKNVMLGVYDYYDVPQWSRDKPPGISWGSTFTPFYEQLNKIQFYAEHNTKVFTAESADGWGARGPLYYTTSKLLWEPNSDYNSILEDFYTKSFGPAKEPMKQYYLLLFSGVPLTDRTLSTMFHHLDDAEKLANGDEKILERIRYMEYYTRYTWFNSLNDRGELDIEGKKDLYNLVHRLRDLYVLHFTERSEQLRSTLTTAGVSNTEILSLENTSPPTPAEARAWMDVALKTLQNPSNVHVVDIHQKNLVPLGHSAPIKSSTQAFGKDFIIFAKSGDNVKMKINYAKNLVVYDPIGNIIDMKDTTQLPSGSTYSFVASKTGLYKISFGVWGNINQESNPTSIYIGPGSGYLSEEKDIYFYVPGNTPAIVLGVEDTFSKSPSFSLYSPEGNKVLSGNCSNGPKQPCDWEVSNPAKGLWTLHYNATNVGANFWLLGVPPLAWHDSNHLLILDNVTPVSSENSEPQTIKNKDEPVTTVSAASPSPSSSSGSSNGDSTLPSYSTVSFTSQNTAPQNIQTESASVIQQEPISSNVVNEKEPDVATVALNNKVGDALMVASNAKGIEITKQWLSVIVGASTIFAISSIIILRRLRFRPL